MRTQFGLFLSLLAAVKGELHQLIVGTFGIEQLYILEFDDVALTLEVIGNSTTQAPASWIALSHDKKNLYTNSFQPGVPPAFLSYTLRNAMDITYDTTVEMSSNCSSARSIYVVAASKPPYAVYGTPFTGAAGCGSVMSVDEGGVLFGVIQNYEYEPSSGVHGLALDSANSFLYSADDSGNALWTHKIDAGTGEVTLVSRIDGPVPHANPRHVAVHPKGRFLYVVLEAANEVAQYSINRSTGVPYFENVTYPLIPPGANSSSYWSDEVALSFSHNYLWATSRAYSTNDTGYISALALTHSGSMAEQLFLIPTTDSGGAANSVAPSGFSDEFVALASDQTGFVQIWRLGDDASEASVVAQVNIAGGRCCANAVWYS